MDVISITVRPAEPNSLQPVISGLDVDDAKSAESAEQTVTFHTDANDRRPSASPASAPPAANGANDAHFRISFLQPRMDALPPPLQRLIVSFVHPHDLSSVALQNRALHAIVNAQPKRRDKITRGRVRKENHVLIRKRETQLIALFRRQRYHVWVLWALNRLNSVLFPPATSLCAITTALALDNSFSLTLGLLPLLIWLAFSFLVQLINLVAYSQAEQNPRSHAELDRATYDIQQPFALPSPLGQAWSHFLLDVQPDSAPFALRVTQKFVIAKRPSHFADHWASIAAFLSTVCLFVFTIAFFVLAILSDSRSLTLDNGVSGLAISALLMCTFAVLVSLSMLLETLDVCFAACVIAWPAWLLLSAAIAAAIASESALANLVLSLFILTTAFSLCSAFAACSKYRVGEVFPPLAGLQIAAILFLGFLGARVGAFGSSQADSWQTHSHFSYLWPLILAAPAASIVEALQRRHSDDLYFAGAGWFGNDL